MTPTADPAARRSLPTGTGTGAAGFSAAAAASQARTGRASSRVADDSCSGTGAARLMGRSLQLPGLTLRRFSSLLVTSPRGLLIFLRQAAQKPSFDQLELSEVTQPSATRRRFYRRRCQAAVSSPSHVRARHPQQIMTPPFGGVCKRGVPARCAGEVR